MGGGCSHPKNHNITNPKVQNVHPSQNQMQPLNKPNNNKTTVQDLKGQYLNPTSANNQQPQANQTKNAPGPNTGNNPGGSQPNMSNNQGSNKNVAILPGQGQANQPQLNAQQNPQQRGAPQQNSQQMTSPQKGNPPQQPAAQGQKSVQQSSSQKTTQQTQQSNSQLPTQQKNNQSGAAQNTQQSSTSLPGQQDQAQGTGSKNNSPNKNDISKISYASYTTNEGSPMKNSTVSIPFKRGPQIGKGSIAEVFECLNLNSGELLAVKSIKIGGDELPRVAEYIEALKKEIRTLKTLSHPNIVKYYSTDVRDADGGTVVDVVLEYVSGGSLKNLMDKFSKLDEKIASHFTRQMLEGLNYLHFNGILHKDIKGSNVLIDPHGKVKLTDFGVGRSLDFTDGSPDLPAYVKKSPNWQAPEVLIQNFYSKPADIWSIGCVVVEMLTGSPPFASQSPYPDEVIKIIQGGRIPSFPDRISEVCKDFLNKCLRFKYDDRPSAFELLNHPFVKVDDDHSFSDTATLHGSQSIPVAGINERSPNKGMAKPASDTLPSKPNNFYYKNNMFSKLKGDSSYGDDEGILELERILSSINNGPDGYQLGKGSRMNNRSVIHELPDEEQLPSTLSQTNRPFFDKQEVPIDTPLSRMLREESVKREKESEKRRLDWKLKWQHELDQENMKASSRSPSKSPNKYTHQSRSPDLKNLGRSPGSVNKRG